MSLPPLPMITAILSLLFLIWLAHVLRGRPAAPPPAPPTLWIIIENNTIEDRGRREPPPPKPLPDSLTKLLKPTKGEVPWKLNA